MKWFLECITKKYATFSGRATRTEYWMYQLIVAIVSIIFYLLCIIAESAQNETLAMIFALLMSIFGLAVFIPGLAVSVRRLHDSDKSGWFILLVFVPLVGGIIIIVLMCLPSTAGKNRFDSFPHKIENEV